MSGLERFDTEALMGLLCAPFERALWEEAMAEDCHLRVGNGCPRIGRHAALPELERLLMAIDQVGADYCDAWQRRETIIVETDLTVLSRGIRTAVVPCAIFARVTAKKLRDLRFYLDPAPLKLEGARTSC